MCTIVCLFSTLSCHLLSNKTNASFHPLLVHCTFSNLQLISAIVWAKFSNSDSYIVWKERSAWCWSVHLVLHVVDADSTVNQSISNGLLFGSQSSAFYMLFFFFFSLHFFLLCCFCFIIKFLLFLVIYIFVVRCHTNTCYKRKLFMRPCI